jgi:hypothetical protein
MATPDGGAASPPATAPEAPQGSAPATPQGAAPAAAAPAAQVPTTPAHWDGARIVSEFVNRRGGKISETWELAKGGKQLVVHTSMPAMGDRPGMEIKRVYDRVEE